jgi:large subunit ribosomal protein L23
MAKKKETKGTATVQSYGILLSPVITEKSSLIGSGGSTLVFRVAKTATKDEIRSAVQRVFQVDVSAVRTCNYMGKPKRTTRSIGRRAAFKKAYVTLKEGQTIDLVEGL